jgi:hypothetical protein
MEDAHVVCLRLCFGGAPTPIYMKKAFDPSQYEEVKGKRSGHSRSTYGVDRRGYATAHV